MRIDNDIGSAIESNRNGIPLIRDSPRIFSIRAKWDYKKLSDIAINNV